MSRISDVLDQYAERFPDCDWRFRAGRMAEEILGLRDQLLRSSDDSHTDSRIKPDLSATAYKAESQDVCKRCGHPDCRRFTSDDIKFIEECQNLPPQTQDACDHPGRQLGEICDSCHPVKVERGKVTSVKPVKLDAQSECACGGIAPFHYNKCPNKQKTQNARTHNIFCSVVGPVDSCHVCNAQQVSRPPEDTASAFCYPCQVGWDPDKETHSCKVDKP